ncbi:hypothetical protein LCGC14_2571950, partial [marine sediment metagenome]
RNPDLQGLPNEDVEETDFPPDRTNRHAWRLRPNKKVQMDLSVPKPPHPQQGKIDDIENATNIGQLKAAMIAWIKK